MQDLVPTAQEAVFVHQFPSGERGEVRAYLQPFKGELLAHLRRFERRANGVYQPTRKGLAVRPHELTELVIAAAMLAAEGRERV